MEGEGANGEPNASSKVSTGDKLGGSDSKRNIDDVSDPALNNKPGGNTGDASISNPNNTAFGSSTTNPAAAAEPEVASLANQLEEYRKVLSSPKGGPMVTFRQ